MSRAVVLLQQGSNALRGIFLQAGHDVRIDVEGEGDSGVSQALAYDLGWNPRL